MREVSLLSRIHHRYCLRYYQAWLEELQEQDDQIDILKNDCKKRIPAHHNALLTGSGSNDALKKLCSGKKLIRAVVSQELSEE